MPNLISRKEISSQSRRRLRMAGGAVSDGRPRTGTFSRADNLVGPLQVNCSTRRDDCQVGQISLAICGSKIPRGCRCANPGLSLSTASLCSSSVSCRTNRGLFNHVILRNMPFVKNWNGHSDHTHPLCHDFTCPQMYLDHDEVVMPSLCNPPASSHDKNTGTLATRPA